MCKSNTMKLVSIVEMSPFLLKGNIFYFRLPYSVLVVYEFLFLQHRYRFIKLAENGI